eukprot:gene22840-1376_t
MLHWPITAGSRTLHNRLRRMFEKGRSTVDKLEVLHHHFFLNKSKNYFIHYEDTPILITRIDLSIVPLATGMTAFALVLIGIIGGIESSRYYKRKRKTTEGNCLLVERAKRVWAKYKSIISSAFMVFDMALDIYFIVQMMKIGRKFGRAGGVYGHSVGRNAFRNQWLRMASASIIIMLLNFLVTIGAWLYFVVYKKQALATFVPRMQFLEAMLEAGPH